MDYWFFLPQETTSQADLEEVENDDSTGEAAATIPSSSTDEPEQGSASSFLHMDATAKAGEQSVEQSFSEQSRRYSALREHMLVKAVPDGGRSLPTKGLPSLEGPLKRSMEESMRLRSVRRSLEDVVARLRHLCYIAKVCPGYQLFA